MELLLREADTAQLLDAFKNKFNLCETAYKVILKEHQRAKGKSVNGHLIVTMNQVPHALRFAGYDFDGALLNELFGADSRTEGKRKTVKKLRDAITHGLDDKAVEEIITRQDELFGFMEAFLAVIRNA